MLPIFIGHSTLQSCQSWINMLKTRLVLPGMSVAVV
jgi:hypothetical protein